MYHILSRWEKVVSFGIGPYSHYKPNDGELVLIFQEKDFLHRSWSLFQK